MQQTGKRWCLPAVLEHFYHQCHSRQHASISTTDVTRDSTRPWSPLSLTSLPVTSKSKSHPRLGGWRLSPTPTPTHVSCHMSEKWAWRGWPSHGIFLVINNNCHIKQMQHHSHTKFHFTFIRHVCIIALCRSCNGKVEIGIFHFWERNKSGIFGHG